jgi:phosphonate transport system substrate-binding protein
MISRCFSAGRARKRARARRLGRLMSTGRTVISRRSLLLAGGSTLALAASGTLPAANRDHFRIGLTPVFLDNQVELLETWRAYLERGLGAGVSFIQRQTYREITDLLLSSQLEAAWVCGFPYVRNEGRMRLLAVPLYEGEPLYQAYLIVPSADDKTARLQDLRGRIFVFSDPDSNSGFLDPQVRLIHAGEDPGGFFGRTFFTWSHRDVIVAVAEGLADGGSVDGYVWETLRRHHPELVARTRVVSRSQRYGFPPFVTPSSLPEADFVHLQKLMTGMPDHPAGGDLLAQLNLDGFVPGDPALFDGIRRSLRVFDGS